MNDSVFFYKIRDREKVRVNSAVDPQRLLMGINWSKNKLLTKLLLIII